MNRIGIGIVTYNRPASLATSLGLVLKFTPAAHSIVVVDDESSNETPQLMKREFIGSGVMYCRGRNSGVAWNKNRALFYLSSLRKCDCVILLEDDTFPMAFGWEDDWIAGAERYGHINLAASWFPTPFRSGDGTIANPFVGADVTAQCAAFSAEALAMVGFMDTRFPRNGYAHPEHSYRMVRAGYGGLIRPGGVVDYYMIDSPVAVRNEPSFAGNPHMLAQNRETYLRIRDESIHRCAWRGEFEFSQFRAEMRGVVQL